jgi:peptidyl-prolyl cis-trans isomerase NIMA-interacting 1
MAFRASPPLLPRPSRRSARGRWQRPLLALLPGLLSCADLTRPPAHRLLSGSAIAALQPAAVSPAAAPPAPPASDQRPLSPQPPTVVAADGTTRDQIGASHILVAYQGATRSKPTVTRTKDDARKLAQSLAERARQPGTDFAQLAREASDGPTGIEGGALPKFGRQQMVKPFSDAAFALQPGQISDVVETNFGFHIIKRTE